MLSVAIEEETDCMVINTLLKRAGIANAQFTVAKGHLAPTPQGRKRLDRLSLGRPLIVVYDQDSGSVGDAVVTNDRASDILYCPAIPSVDAWLFADSDAFFEILGDKAEQFAGRMPLPEQLPYPRFLKSTMLRNNETLSRLLERIDILVAGARSPSLKYFIQTARMISGLPSMPFDEPSNLSGQIDREILRNLISEVYPSDKALFRAASGAIITAEQMMQEITDGTSLGREYSSDILRVARDLLARQAQKKTGWIINGQ